MAKRARRAGNSAKESPAQGGRQTGVMNAYTVGTSRGIACMRWTVVTCRTTNETCACMQMFCEEKRADVAAAKFRHRPVCTAKLLAAQWQTASQAEKGQEGTEGWHFRQAPAQGGRRTGVKIAYTMGTSQGIACMRWTVVTCRTANETRACMQMCCKEKRADVAAANPGTDLFAQQKLLAAQWRTAPKAERAHYTACHAVRLRTSCVSPGRCKRCQLSSLAYVELEFLRRVTQCIAQERRLSVQLCAGD